MSMLLQVEDLSVHFNVKKNWTNTTLKAVDGVSFKLNRAEVLGIVGESGCGKSTTARALLQLIRPTTGKVTFDDKDITAMWKRSWSGRFVWDKELIQLRQRMQFVFQDPYSSLNPRMTLESILSEPLKVLGTFSKQQRREKVQTLLTQVGIDPSYIRRFPHEFSGGQRQRIGIARALAMSPDLIVADEPVSALDVSIQAQILNLLQDLQKSLGLTLIFVAHDLGAIRYLSQRIAVMYLGRIVELGGAEDICSSPKHPYTQVLLSAALDTKPQERSKRLKVVGEVSDTSVYGGCAFAPRCDQVVQKCREEVPKARILSDGREVACHLAE